MIALDLFCGGGGAALGLMWAGFEVYGIDHKPRKNYPGHFIQGDALNPPVNIMDFDIVWTSPPCQLFTPASRNRSEKWRKHPNLIPQTRELLAQHSFTVIENVPQAVSMGPMRPDLVLWGVQFGLETLWRKRVFELSFWCPEPRRQKMKRGTYYTIAGSLGSSNHFYRRKEEGKPGTLTKLEAKHTMGIPICQRMTKKEIVESVAPPMAEYIASEAMRQLTGAKE